jgi:molybdopterin converting factor small subunit
MPIQVLFFGATSAITGTRRIAVEVCNGTKATDVFEQLMCDYPKLAEHKLLFSINLQYAAGDETISDGDELAFFTAVSGG